MTHHGKKGGRALELLLLLCVILLTIILIALGFCIPIYVFGDHTGHGRGNLAPWGAVAGGIISGVFWRALLRYYKYSTDLKPIIVETDNMNDEEFRSQVIEHETKVNKVKVISSDLDELKRRLGE